MTTNQWTQIDEAKGGKYCKTINRFRFKYGYLSKGRLWLSVYDTVNRVAKLFKDEYFETVTDIDNYVSEYVSEHMDDEVLDPIVDDDEFVNQYNRK